MSDTSRLRDNPMADSHTGLCLTIDGLNKLRPCTDDGRRVRAALRKLNADKAHRFTAAEAREAGCTFDDIVWAAAKVAENDKAAERRLRHWTADCAARVLHIFEDAYPGDKRPRQAIEAARLFADGEIDAGASDAAWAAAWAARDAAWDAEEQWQFDRLILWLSDPEPLPLPAKVLGEAGEPT
jgi:hypothetical protein